MINNSELENKNESFPKDEKKGYKLPRPYLLKRVFAALIDFVVAFILFMVLEAGEYYTVFNNLGYHTMINEIHAMYEDSHLYTYDDSSRTYLELTSTYDDSKTPKENYDNNLIYYFTNDARCIEDKKIDSYNDAKINSGYFKKDSSGNINENADIDGTKLKLFYETQYKNALTYFSNNPTYKIDLSKTYYIVIYSILINIIISSAIFYLLIPILRKDGETIGYMIFKIGVCDARDDTKVKKFQIFIRYFVFTVFNFLIPLFIYTKWTYFTLVPVFITCIMIMATHSNSGLHEYISKTYVFDKKDIVIPSKRMAKKEKSNTNEVHVFNPLHKEGEE